MPHELEDSGVVELTPSSEVSSRDDASPVAANWPRFAYIFEYLLALQVVLAMWTEIGGPGHMDLIPWYLKLCCIALESYYIVRFTASAVQSASIWSRNSRIYFTGVVILAVVMGGITFYYHLHEPAENPDSDETVTKSALHLQSMEHMDPA